MTATEHVAGTTGKEFVISRTFDAPRERVWKAWSEAEQLERWWGPKGFAIHIAKLAFRPGGVFHYRMRASNGHEMWGRFAYREIVAPERIIFVSSFSDEKGGIARAPFSETWPFEILNNLTLTEEDGKTVVMLRGGPINATDEERKMFAGFFDSMRQGFGGTFDQLEAHLAKALS